MDETNMSPYVIEEVETEHGVDLIIRTRAGYVIDFVGEVADGTHAKRVHVREVDHAAPRVGSRIMVDGRLIEVAETRYGHGGQLMVLDAITRVWVVVP